MESVKRHLKRDYERELIVNQQGKINHNNCVDHCLLYAFGTCIDVHTSRCENCANFYIFFKNKLRKNNYKINKNSRNGFFIFIF